MIVAALRPDDDTPAPADHVRILVAGVGNILRADDGFGVAVAQRLDAMELPPGVRVVETGIGGIALVHELSDGFDALIVADAVERERPPGTVMIIEPDVIDAHAMPLIDRHDMLADMHLATPDRAFMLAKALGVLPPKVILVGCEPTDAHVFSQGLSPPVVAAVEVAVQEILRQIAELTGELRQVGIESQPGRFDEDGD